MAILMQIFTTSGALTLAVYGKVYFAKCGLRNAEFQKDVICGILVMECSANYTLYFFHIPQNSNYLFTIAHI